MEIKIINQITPELCRSIEELEQLVFPNTYRPGRFSEEAPQKQDLIGLLAYENNQLVAYKVGYKLKPNVFYSWVGGVHPQHRGQGLSKQLMEFQHNLLRDHQYQQVRTKTRMSFRRMLILNLKYGFDITGLSYKASISGLVIQLEKSL